MLRRFALPPLLTSHSSHTLVIGLTAALSLTLDVTGALHVYGLSSWMGQKLALGASLALVGISIGWVSLASSPIMTPSQVREHRKWQRLLMLLILLAWIATTRNVLVFLAPEVSLSEKVWFIAGTLLLGFTLVRPPQRTRMVLLAVLLGCGARALCLSYVPIEPERADMLPLVQRALENLLAGRSPYTIYYMPWQMPLTYLPVTWLAYLPANVFGFDIRVTNILAELLVGSIVTWLAADCPPFVGDTTVLLWAWMFLQPSMLNWSLTTTAPIWWVVLAATLALVIACRRGVWLGLGLGLAASPLAAVVWPFVVLVLLRYRGWGHTARIVTAAGLCAAVLIIPFLLWSPQLFVFGVWRWFNDTNLFPQLRWDMDNTWASMVGFSGVFWRRNMEGLLKPIQAALLIGLALHFWWRGASKFQLAPYVIAAFLLFTVFNPVLWPYLYTPALIATLLVQPALHRTLTNDGSLPRATYRRPPA